MSTRAEYDFSSAKKNPYAVKPDRQVSNTFVDSAKVMAKGQITIPNDVREVLGVSSGDRVSLLPLSSSAVFEAARDPIPAEHMKRAKTDVRPD